MALKKAQFEVTDTEGSTEHYSSTVDTTPVAIPSSPDKLIGEFWIENRITNTPATKTLSFSCDGGSTYTELRLGESMAWTPKGPIKQVYIKANSASTAYQMIINFEEYG